MKILDFKINSTVINDNIPVNISIHNIIVFLSLTIFQNTNKNQ